MGSSADYGRDCRGLITLGFIVGTGRRASVSSAAADRLDDFDPIALGQDAFLWRLPGHDFAIDFDRDPALAVAGGLQQGRRPIAVRGMRGSPLSSIRMDVILPRCGRPGPGFIIPAVAGVAQW